MNNIDEYLLVLNQLDEITNTAFNISNELNGTHTNDWRKYYGSIVFKKLCLHAKSFRKLCPQTNADGNIIFDEMWDLPSMCSISRAIIDSYCVQYYILIEEISEDENNFRKHLWHYHSEKSRLKGLEKIKSKDPRLKKLEDEIERHKKLLLETEIYKGLEKHNQRSIRKGQVAVNLSNSEISKRAGIDPGYYKSTFDLFSSYVHTHPMALSHLMKFYADSEKSLNLITTTVKHTVAFITHAVRDMANKFPNTKQLISKDSEFLIKNWENLLNNFNE